MDKAEDLNSLERVCERGRRFYDRRRGVGVPDEALRGQLWTCRRSIRTMELVVMGAEYRIPLFLVRISSKRLADTTRRGTSKLVRDAQP